MALTADALEIETPCPITLSRDLSDGRHRAWGCGHCDKTVHVLSSMTERDARQFLTAHEGETLCITYMVGRDGEIRFQPEAPLVPLSRLTRRRAVAAAGLAAALAACTPTAAPKPVDPTPVMAIELDAKSSPSDTSMAQLVADARDQAAAEAAEEAAAAEAAAREAAERARAEAETTPIADEHAIARPGGIRVPSIPAPPSPLRAEPMKRGGKRILPITK